MDIFEKVNNLEILTVLEAAWIGVHKDSSHTYTIKKPDGTLDSSFKVSVTNNIAKDFGWSGIEWWPFDFIGRYLLKEDTQTNVWKANTIKWFIDKWLVESPEQKKEFIKSLKNEELLERFNEFKLGGYKQEISSLMLTRWVSSEIIKKKQLELGEIFKDIGYYDNYYCTEKPVYQDEEWNWKHEEWDAPKTVWVFMFPCYDGSEEKNLIWIKLRRKDGKTIRGKKSLAVWKTGILYDHIGKDKIIIVEWEMDYIILKMLWYKSVVANCGWVQSCRSYLKSRLYETDKIICLYDNDTAWLNGKKALWETMERSIYTVDYPIRENSKWVVLSDVNDFYRAWYDTKPKWEKILSEIYVVWDSNKKENNSRFIMLDKHLEYYDTKYMKYQKKESVAWFLWMSSKELFQSVQVWTIPSYEDLCYWYWGKEGFYNTLREDNIITHWGKEEPILHPAIEKLIFNICNGKKKNIEWVHKSILYKITHINDVHIPALILYWSGWSWKGTFLNLLASIFWEENTQIWLWQKDLESWFDAYQWNKLIVEFKEVSSGNKHNDKKILDRIKSFVWEPKISVRSLHKDSREVDNIARFHLSSNHAVPIQLDSKHSGNRRFTIIKTWNKLNSELAKEVNQEVIPNKTLIKQYVSWLYDTYPEVIEMKSLPALENKEKEMLEDNCSSVADQFFERLEEKYPYVYKITNVEKNYLLDKYCTEMWENSYDAKFKQSNFDLWLWHRYEKKALKIDGKTTRWYFINKTPFELKHLPESPDKWRFRSDDLPPL